MIRHREQGASVACDMQVACRLLPICCVPWAVQCLSRSYSGGTLRAGFAPHHPTPRARPPACPPQCGARTGEVDKVEGADDREIESGVAP